MKFNDCPECHTELSEYACSLHRVAPDLLAALKAAPKPNWRSPVNQHEEDYEDWYKAKGAPAIAKAEEGS